MKYCDIIVPGGGNNDIALEMVAQNLKTIMKRKKNQIYEIQDQINVQLQRFFNVDKSVKFSQDILK